MRRLMLLLVAGSVLAAATAPAAQATVSPGGFCSDQATLVATGTSCSFVVSGAQAVNARVGVFTQAGVVFGEVTITTAGGSVIAQSGCGPALIGCSAATDAVPVSVSVIVTCRAQGNPFAVEPKVPSVGVPDIFLSCQSQRFD